MPGVRGLAWQLRAAAGDRGRHTGRRGGAPPRRRVLRGARPCRVQHSGITFGGRYDGRPRSPPTAPCPRPTRRTSTSQPCVPRRPGAAFVDARRAFALRPVRLRLDVAAVAKRKRRTPPLLSPMIKVLDLESEEARELYGADFLSLFVPTRSLRGAAIPTPDWRSSSASCVVFFLALGPGQPSLKARSKAARQPSARR